MNALQNNMREKFKRTWSNSQINISVRLELNDRVHTEFRLH